MRNGTYGVATPRRRQRYRCQPPGDAKAHSFTPPLPRDHVHVGDEHCDSCDELVGIHRGETAVARRHSWSTRIVARGLEMMSRGSAYADVGRWALRVTGTERSRQAPAKRPATRSAASRASRNAWHIGADWVEAFSPVIYGPVDERLRVESLAERARLDALCDAGADLDRPQIIVIDDTNFRGRDLEVKSGRSRQAGFHVLALAEMVWPSPTPRRVRGKAVSVGVDVAAAELGMRLRLVRAMPNVTTNAWLLVLDELGYDPDFIVTDGGVGADGAIRRLFDPFRTTVVPSLWHLAQSVERAFEGYPSAWEPSTSRGSVLIEPLRVHLRRLSRDSGALSDVHAWFRWWDELMELAKDIKLPVGKVQRSRAKWEPAVFNAIPAINRYPQMPISTGGLENQMVKHIKPLMAMRRTAFANIERTNLLFDLVVARQHGAFDHLNEVARLLREDGAAEGGWTVPLRTIADPRPHDAHYSSLRDAVLINDLVQTRGLA